MFPHSVRFVCAIRPASAAAHDTALWRTCFMLDVVLLVFLFCSGVTLGESLTKTFMIINEGALDVDWVMQRGDSSNDAFRVSTLQKRTITVGGSLA